MDKALLQISQLQNDLNSFGLKDLCRDLSTSLHLPVELDRAKFLLALSGIESSYALNNIPKFEPSFAPGGRYFNDSMKQLYKRFGAYASCSYGPWQIMGIKAVELGYANHPSFLWDGRVSGPYVVKFLNQIIASGARTVEEILDSYNTGSFRSGERPQNYITRFWGFYGDHIQTSNNSGEK